ncbi:MAG: Lar family restriction alleviation protein [Kiritimatiellae bacterium]|nr:Lar family restriction alleviation protein [Kiritimatiellia bacterium]
MEIKPCPFCGGKAELRSRKVRNSDLGTCASWVACTVCESTGKCFSLDGKEEAAVAFWNTRQKTLKGNPEMKENLNDIIAEMRDATMNGEFDDETVNAWADRLEAASTF